ncbi:MAG: hypothetical protein ACXVJ7_14050 [Acidimicrobiia bacterium]
MRIATALWRVTPELVTAIDEHLGPPVDSYVNGSQTWFQDEPVLEWRLHPVAGFRQPGGISPYDLWDAVVGALSAGEDPDALSVGDTTVALDALWEGLECFPAFDDELEPIAVVRRAEQVLPIPPDLHGLVDHDAVGDAWEQADGAVSIVALLSAQLAG